MEHDLFSEGVCCVEFTAVGVEKFIKLADQLGIDWLAIADKDQAGDGYVRSTTRQLNGRDAANHIRQLPSGAIEAYLCSEGFGDIYEANISPQKAGSIVAAKGTAEYWDQVLNAQSNGKRKPELVAEVISRIEGTGAAAIPPLVRDVISLAALRSEATG
jgi:predicted ATP-dependent endonuclease of OLD family